MYIYTYFAYFNMKMFKYQCLIENALIRIFSKKHFLKKQSIFWFVQETS